MMFRPRESYDQQVLESRLIIGPEPAKLRHVQDVFGNVVGIAHVEGKASQLAFDSLSYYRGMEVAVTVEPSAAPRVALAATA